MSELNDLLEESKRIGIPSIRSLAFCVEWWVARFKDESKREEFGLALYERLTSAPHIHELDVDYNSRGILKSIVDEIGASQDSFSGKLLTRRRSNGFWYAKQGYAGGMIPLEVCLEYVQGEDHGVHRCGKPAVSIVDDQALCHDHALEWVEAQHLKMGLHK